MKKILFPLALLSLISIFFSSCSSCSTKPAERDLSYSPYVEAFTHGKISRNAPAYLIFNQDVELEKLTDDKSFKRALQIRPKIDGEFTYDDNRTVVFRPKGEYRRDTEYSIVANIDYFFDDAALKEKFSFSFSTLPIQLRGSFESLTINEENSETYDVVCNIYTPDFEEEEIVESLIEISEKVKTEWEHSESGKQHKLTLKAIPAGKKGVKTLTVAVGSNKMGLVKEKLVSVYIPNEDEFGVYDVIHVNEPEKYVEVTFTKLLNSDQNLRGLAYISGNRSETVNVDGNSLRLYPDMGLKGNISIYLDGEIKSESGLTLGETIVREIDITPEVPRVRFIGEGVIVPESDEVLIPFQTVYLRGVVVRVIKVLQQNIGQFLQRNNIDDSRELIRVGRLVARKTIFFDEENQDLSMWNTYAVDLKELVDPEPGAIYRVELSFNKDLSAYPCVDEKPAKEEMIAADEVKFKEELNQFDEGGYYYYYDDGYSWYDYEYSQRNNPCHVSFYMSNTTLVGRNVLSTNIGLMAKRGEDNEMIVLAHNLLTTAPERGVDIEVFNYQQISLGKGMTNNEGRVDIKLKSIGIPYYIVAKQGEQRSYLKIEDNMALSLSDFDVSGVELQKGLKGFIYGERGVWRPGDDMYLSFMLKDRDKILPKDHPVVMELYTPLGQLYAKQSQNRGSMGLYVFTMKTEPDAQTGAWEVKVHVGGATFTKRIRVETIKPNRLKVDLNFKDDILTRGVSAAADMHVEWLQGATARNLKYEMDVSLYSVPTTFDNFKNFNFDDPTKQFETEETEFTKGTTDSKGDAIVSGVINLGDQAPGMLMASFDTRVYEESGDFSIDVLRKQFSPYKSYVGIQSPQKSMDQLHTGKDHLFEVASVDMHGKPISNSNLEVRVYKVSWYWWWSANRERIANYVSNRHQAIKTIQSVKTDASGKGSFTLNMYDSEWGTYYIEVRDPDSGHSSGVLSYFDWASMFGRRQADGTDAAVKLTFSTSKEEYAVGEEMVITIPSSAGSRAIVSIENGAKVLSIKEYDCSAEETTIRMYATAAMMPNAYVHVTLLQPHGATINDLPIRMYGVVPISVTSSETHLTPVVQTPNEIKPESSYRLSVNEKNGREMAYTIAVVDEGLLDLTRFQTPSPWDAFYAREALGVKTWDMYNYVVGAYGGRIEQLFSIGGDASLLAGPKATVNRFKPVVEFIGPFTLKRGEKANHTLTMPNYNGRVRVMVVAGDGEAYGATDKSVMVRKPVMLLGTLPRVIGINEEMAIPATVFATEENVGDVNVSITCSDNMEVMGSATQKLTFTDVMDKQATFRVKVGPQSGVGKVKITAVSKNDRSVYETEMEIRSVRRPQVEVISGTVLAGKKWTNQVTLPGADGTNKMSLEMSNVKPINLASRLGFLLGYPHTCIEQITSKAFPQLYISEFALLSEKQEQEINDVVKFVLGRYKSYQVVGGGMAYWAGNSTPNAWGSAYVGHFLIEAEAKGYYVDASVKSRLLNYLTVISRSWNAVRANNFWRSEETTQAYRLYVLALANRPEIGAMNRLKERTNMAASTRSLLAAAYAKAGRVDVAKEILHSTAPMEPYTYGQYDYTFGSSTRDDALQLLALVSTDSGGEAANVHNKISNELASDRWLSTQTTGFALVALSKYIEKYNVAESMKFSYKCEGNSENVNTTNNIWSKELLTNHKREASIEITNNSESTLFVRLINEGTPDEGEEKAYQNGLNLKVDYRDSKGQPIDITNLPQGTNFTAFVTVGNPEYEAYNNIELTHIFPAGWEILNTRFADEDRGENQAHGVSYQDIRDDRVYTYIDRLPRNRKVTVSVNLAAVYSGKFYCPPVYTQAMYDNEIRANNTGRYVEVKPE